MTAVLDPPPRIEKRASMTRMLHVISNLETGGAEMMVLKLLAASNATEENASVVSLIEKGTIGPRIEQLGIPVYALGLRAPARLASAALTLRRLASAHRTDVVVGWMYHGNLAASFAALAALRGQVVWNVVHSVYDLAFEKPATARLIKIGARLSSTTNAIIYNSHRSREQHERLGYDPRPGVVIPNGFDVRRFAPRAEARAEVRREIGVHDDTLLVGLMGRYHPMKDHAGFIAAAARVHARCPSVHFVLAGRGVDSGTPELLTAVRDAGLEKVVHLLGERSDMPTLNAALDIAVSSSWSEGSPSVVGEAMACGVPCVVTDVGDSAWVVGDAGFTVPARDPAALADACVSLLEASNERRRELGAAARQRVCEEFSLDRVTERYMNVLRAAVRGAPRTGANT